MSNLAPCPFCGGEAKFEFDHAYEDIGYAGCQKCRAHIFNDKKSAIDHWNRRTPQWIPVSEFYPVIGRPVLLCINGTVQHTIARLDAYDASDYDTIHFWDFGEDTDGLKLKPEHLWMYLPAPLKEEGHA